MKFRNFYTVHCEPSNFFQKLCEINTFATIYSFHETVTRFSTLLRQIIVLKNLLFLKLSRLQRLHQRPHLNWELYRLFCLYPGHQVLPCVLGNWQNVQTRSGLSFSGIKFRFQTKSLCKTVLFFLSGYADLRN